MKSIRIEQVGDIHSRYNYLEVFSKEDTTPFLEVSISDDRELCFKFYASDKNTQISITDWEQILSVAKDFLPRAIKNEEDFLALDF